MLILSFHLSFYIHPGFAVAGPTGTACMAHYKCVRGSAYAATARAVHTLPLAYSAVEVDASLRFDWSAA